MLNGTKMGRLAAMAALAGSALLVGCNDTAKQEAALLSEENAELRVQLEERASALDAAHGELRDRDRRIAELQQQLTSAPAAAPATDPFAGIKGVTGSFTAGEVTATIESDVLFDPGKTTLKSQAKRSLEQVAGVIRQEYGGLTVRVDGHTDTDPIRKSGFKSNYHLGFERAWVVREFLVSQGLPARNIFVASHGPDRARSTKASSRRVEIAVLVGDDAAY